MYNLKCFFKMALLAHDLERKLQKNRSTKIPKNVKLSFGEVGLIILNEGRIELVQLNIIKRYIKYFVKKVESPVFNRSKIWYSLSPNFFIQRKSKNSRMGKGKGMFERRTIRVQKNTILLEFYGVPFYKLILLEKKINKKLSVKVKLLVKHIQFQRLWSSFNKYSIFYKKYLLK